MRRMAVVMVVLSTLFTAQMAWANEDFVAEFAKFVRESWTQINASGVKVDSPECKEAGLGHDDSQPSFSETGTYRAALMCVAQYAGPLAEKSVSQQVLLRKMHSKLLELKRRYDAEVAENKSVRLDLHKMGVNNSDLRTALAETERSLKVESKRRKSVEEENSTLGWLLIAALAGVLALAILVAWLKFRQGSATDPDSESDPDLTSRLEHVERNVVDMRASIYNMDERVAIRLEPTIRQAVDNGGKARAKAAIAEQIIEKSRERNADMVTSLTRAMEALG